MKAIIKISTKLSPSGELELLSNNLLKLKVCGKELFSYYFDFFNELEVDEIFVLGKDLNSFVDEFYLSKVFSPKVNFIENESSLDYEYLNSHDLLCIYNIGFIYTSFETIKEKIVTLNHSFVLKENTFELSYHKSGESKVNDIDFIKIKAISSLDNYLEVLNYILNRINSVDYTYGYSNDNNIIIGKNVKIAATSKLIEPVVIQDNVKILDNCVIGPNVIISNNVIIENNTNISSSIIYDNTYIGTNLDLQNKIIVSNKIIDKKTFLVYKIDEKLISKNILL